MAKRKRERRWHGWCVEELPKRRKRPKVTHGAAHTSCHATRLAAFRAMAREKKAHLREYGTKLNMRVVKVSPNG